MAVRDRHAGWQYLQYAFCGVKLSSLVTLAKRVSIQLQMTDASLRSRDRVVRSTEKSSLGEAMEFASIWLERALSGKM